MGSRTSYLSPFSGKVAWWRTQGPRNTYPTIPPRVQTIRGRGVRHNKHRRGKQP